MSSRSHAMFRKMGLAAPPVTTVVKKKAQVSAKIDDDAASECSSMTRSEIGILNPQYCTELSGKSKCATWLQEESLQNVASPPRIRQNYGLVDYTPTSTSTNMTYCNSPPNHVSPQVTKHMTCNSTPIHVSPQVIKDMTCKSTPIHDSSQVRKDAKFNSTPIHVSSQVPKEMGLKSQNELPIRVGLQKCKRKLVDTDNVVPKPVPENRNNRAQLGQNKGTSTKYSYKPSTEKDQPDTKDDVKQGENKENNSKLNPYQLLRLKHLQENVAYLKDLGVSELPITDTTPVKRTKCKQTAPRSPIPCQSKRQIPMRGASGVARQLISEAATKNTDLDSSSEEDDDHGSATFTDIDELRDSTSEEEENDAASGEESSGVKSSVNKKRNQNKARGAPDLETERPIPAHTESEEELDRPHSENEQVQQEDDDIHNPENEGLTADNSGTAMTKSAQKRERKQLRNLGKQYTTRKGKVIAAKKRKPPHTCSVRKCQETVTPEIGEKIFQEYWQQSSVNKRRAYVAARLERDEVQRKRPRIDVEKREKQQTFKYFLDINGKRIQVCRGTLLNTLGESDRFIRGVTENKSKSTSGITADDRRGKKTPHALCNTNKAAAVQRHISSFPAYVSHYCRAKTRDQKYLNSDLTVAEMYRLYQAEENPNVSLSTYSTQFKLSGLKFHPPQTDGCDTCDTLDISIKGAATEDARKKLEIQKERHLRRAEKAYELKKTAKHAAKQDHISMVLVADLQQCLPTPHLKCKKIFYSRQLYVLNYTVFDCTTGLTHCYMWSEVEGNRGSNEIATCLLKHILEIVPDGVTKLTLFSDCCSGQNRNSTMSMMMFIALQQHPSLKEIHHIFLIPGHTFMPEVDGKHAVIENYKRRVDKINIPEEWYAAVEKAGNTDTKNFPGGKFKVTHIKSFYDIASLAKDELVRRKICTDKEPFNYLETHWWKYSKNSMGMVHVKSSFCEDAEFRVLSFLRKGLRSDHLRQLHPCLKTLPASRPISEKKKKDLLGLLCYLSEEFHCYYRDLPVSNSTQDLHPNSPDMDEEEDNPTT